VSKYLRNQSDPPSTESIGADPETEQERQRR
jgi:hypothetical protein